MKAVHRGSARELTLALEAPVAQEAERLEPLVMDPAMAQIFATLKRIATTPLPVLLLGETGSGKEVMAEWLHEHSARESGRLVRVNCASFTDSLLESELFGHERGAFTGATATRPGIVQAAHGGTLFLDEVGELSAAAQAKLLRFLESGEFMPVGSTQSRRVNARIVSATHRPLAALTRSGAFRSDLYFRLNGAAIVIPPLRERRCEITPLARLFLRHAALRMQRPEPALDAELAAALERHSWPGNVRELRHAMDRAVAMWSGGPLRLADLALESAAEALAVPARGVPRAAPGPDGSSGSMREAIRRCERERILAALGETRGNQTRAARLLGISRRTLTNKLNLYAIVRGAVAWADAAGGEAPLGH
jgi:two-component system response regulator AtoC